MGVNLVVEDQVESHKSLLVGLKLDLKVVLEPEEVVVVEVELGPS